MSGRRWSVVACAIAFVVACGGGQQSETPEPAMSVGAEEPPPRRRQMEVEGLMGTIPDWKIQEHMNMKMAKFQRCFFDGMGEVEFLGGHMKFYFRVGLDGRVEWVQPRGSSIGHRATEKCLLDRARRGRFPKPKGGGAAEFVWGFEIDSPGGVRQPVSWDEGRVSSLLEQNATLVSDCGADGGGFVVTAYVKPGGEVMAAGAAVDSAEADQGIDCVLDAVRGWSFPDPGSYPAKVTFSLP